MLRSHFEIEAVLKSGQPNQTKIDELFKAYVSKSDKDKKEFVLALIAEHVFLETQRSSIAPPVQEGE